MANRTRTCRFIWIPNSTEHSCLTRMPKRHGKRAKRRYKSYPDPWISQCEPWFSNAEASNSNIHYTSQQLNHWPSEALESHESWNRLPFQCINQWTPAATIGQEYNQMSSGHWAPLNELPPEIWNNQPSIPLIQQPPLQVNYTSGRNVIPIKKKITPSRSKTPLLSTPSGQSFNSDLSELSRSTIPLAESSCSQNRAPLLCTPSGQTFNSDLSELNGSRTPLLSTPKPYAESVRSTIPLAAPCSQTRASLLSTPSGQTFNSDRPESGWSTISLAASSRSQSRAPLLSTPSSEPCVSNHANAARSSTRRESVAFSSQNPSTSKSSKESNRSTIYSIQHSSIGAQITGTPKRQASFRKIEFNKNGELQVHVGDAAADDDDEEEDVQYLYCVDNNKGKLVEFVDLSDDLQTSEGQNSYTSIHSSTEVNESRFEKNCDTPMITFNEKKGYVEGRRNRQSAHCNRCHKSYENLYKQKYDLYVAKCGHLFCVLCLKKLKSNKCRNCGKAISNFSKIIL